MTRVSRMASAFHLRSPLSLARSRRLRWIQNGAVAVPFSRSRNLLFSLITRCIGRCGSASFIMAVHNRCHDSPLTDRPPQSLGMQAACQNMESMVCRHGLRTDRTGAVNHALPKSQSFLQNGMGRLGALVSPEGVWTSNHARRNAWPVSSRALCFLCQRPGIVLPGSDSSMGGLFIA